MQRKHPVVVFFNGSNSVASGLRIPYEPPVFAEQPHAVPITISILLGLMPPAILLKRDPAGQCGLRGLTHPCL